MEREKINQTIDDCVEGMKGIDKNYDRQERIKVCEKEEKFYRPKFEALGIQPRIVSEIYGYRNSEEGIQKIKNNIGQYLIN